MKTLIFILFTSIGFMYSCDNKIHNRESFSIPEISKEVSKDTVSLIVKIKEKINQKCNCQQQEKYEHQSNSDLTLHQRNWKKDKSIFSVSNSDSLIKNIKVIRLLQFDSVPMELSILKNVNTVLISTRNGIIGLDIFPNLEKVEFWGSSIKLPKKQKWMSRIKYLRLEKTVIKELESISLFENLTQLDMFFSGFYDLVPEFNSLSYLNRLHINAYRGLAINLNSIDLSKMNCLKYLYVLDVYKTTLGMPINLTESTLDYIYLKNNEMTDKDKSDIKKYKESR